MLNAFKIPPVHLFAPEAQAPHLSFCLVAAFPERVASIMVLGGYPLREAHRQTFWEMAPSHFNPWNEERWFEVLHALVDMIYGPQQHSITPDALDALIDADARTCINRPEVIYLTWKCFLEVRQVAFAD